MEAIFSPILKLSRKYPKLLGGVKAISYLKFVFTLYK